MSLDSSRDRRLVSAGRSSALERTGEVVVVGALALALVGVLVVFGVVGLETTVAGVAFYRLVGLATAALGALVLGAGAASYTGTVDSHPDDHVALPTALGFGVGGFAVGGLVASQTLGLSTAWPLAALVVGVVVAGVAVFPREDVGVTLPVGVFALGVGAVVAAGVVAPGWTWQPIENSATYPADIAIPFLALVTGLVVAWVGARARDGFGTQGRQSGAYLLVGINAAAMLGLLLLIVGYVASRGYGPMTRGIKLGLFWDPQFWFYFAPIDEYVVFSTPLVWFHWPFTMNGVALMNEINGIAPAIVGTVWVVAGAVTFSVPLGVGAAVFLTEYAEQGRFTQLVEISTNGLWSTPSIVYGLFGLAFLVPRLGNTTSLLSGMIVLGVMMLPLVVITSRESLQSVPDEYRDASAALGVGKWETIRSVVLPAAMPGVITGVILGVGRIAGETAPILLVMVGDPFPSVGAKVLQSFQFTASPPFVTNPALVQPASALPYQLYAVITAGVGQRPSFAWGTALVLLLVVIGFYAIGIGSRIYFRRKLNQ
ncbi:phosphate ABC transporter permease PstA [Candidatus Halobonum tyrrellensis]|uniref:Phosphate transport system permease protein PstA n=1 Tax=Candidatus Halobonum tyrrellensis G22 TaxID=1324957 RepID=V4HEB7_9EURY|nr:phosphate ABC transporter permease PstA [Candidatus Halobonum tyrrellensis]ESP88413.1 phosphate ABC transporter permease [Candidatus Halobonum tyrrellensis G22]